MNLKRVLAIIVSLSLLFSPVMAVERCNEVDNGFLKQTDMYSCGPISIVNAIKAMNYSFDEIAWFKYLQEQCHTSPNGGTSGGGLEVGIQAIIEGTGITYRKKSVSYLKDLDAELVDDNVVIVFSRCQSHFFTVAYKRDGKYFSLNRFSGRNTTSRQFTTEQSMAGALGNGRNTPAILYILQKAR